MKRCWGFKIKCNYLVCISSGPRPLLLVVDVVVVVNVSVVATRFPDHGSVVVVVTTGLLLLLLLLLLVVLEAVAQVPHKVVHGPASVAAAATVVVVLMVPRPAAAGVGRARGEVGAVRARRVRLVTGPAHICPDAGQLFLLS